MLTEKEAECQWFSNFPVQKKFLEDLLKIPISGPHLQESDSEMSNKQSVFSKNLS